MKLHDLPIEIISEIVEYVPVKYIFNFLLISKEFYQLIEYDDVFWKCVLKNYLKSEIKNCKDNLNENLNNKDALQEFLNIYSLENIEKINKNKIYYNNLKKLNKNISLFSSMNIKLLQQFVELYKNNIIREISVNKPSFRKYLLKDLQFNKSDNNVNNVNTDNNTIVMNQSGNVTFSKRFLYLLQQSIKCKCSILISCLTDYPFSEEFQYLFKEIFLLENEITMIDIDNKFKEIEDYNKKKDLQFIFELLKDIKSKLGLQNFIYEKFLSKFILFIDPIVYSFLVNYSQNSNHKLLQNILQLLKKYNLTLSFYNLLKCCEMDLFNISKEFFEYSVITMNDKLYKDYNNNYNNDYSIASLIITTIMDKDYNRLKKINFNQRNITVNNENNKDYNEFYEKLNYLMDLFITENCDRNKLISYLTEIFIHKKLVNLLTCEEDSSKEIYNLFNSLQFFKYKDIKLPINHDFFSLQYNLENFKYLINLNIISKDDLLTLFHRYFVSVNSFRLIVDKEFTKNQIKLYLNYFINELNFDIYSKDKSGSNIIFNALYNCNFYTIIGPIKECCNLQNIDYNKITFYNSQNILQRQLTDRLGDEQLYNIIELNKIKLNSMKEILEINEINHSHLFNLNLQHFDQQYFNPQKYLSTLKYLFFNIKLKKDRSVTFIEYLFKILENDEKRNELEQLYNSKKEKIMRKHYKKIDFHSDLIIYFIYKKFYSYLKEFCIFKNNYKN
ncbi:hypothetical protein ABK040_000761 [Willaertia magna]